MKNCKCKQFCIYLDIEFQIIYNKRSIYYMEIFMRILIAYASKNGSTASCVERLVRGLSGLDVSVANLAESAPNVAEFEMVMIGSGVHHHRFPAPVRHFLREQKDVLKEKKLGLFLLCGIAEEQVYYMEKLFPAELRAHAFEIAFFGGSLRYDGLSFWDKFFVWNLRSRIVEADMSEGEYIASMPGLLPENVDRMASIARKELFRV